MSYAIHEQCRRWMTSRRYYYYGRDQKEWDHDREDGDQHDVDVDSDIAASDPRGNPIDLRR